MKVHVSYTVKVDDNWRMALNHSWGECRTLASREDVKRYLERVGSTMDDDLMQDWQDCEVCQAAL